MGDFNSPPTGGDSGAYQITTGKAPLVQVDRKFTETYTPGGNQLPDFKFLDTRVETPRFNVSANFATFTGWSSTVAKGWTMIDFVLGGSNRGWCVDFPDHSCTLKGAARTPFDVSLADDGSCVNRAGHLPHARSVKG